MFEDNVIYFGLTALAFIIKTGKLARKLIRKRAREIMIKLSIIIMPTVMPAAIKPAISPTRFMNYGQNIAFMATAKSLQF